MFGRQSNSDFGMPLLQRALLSKKPQPRRCDDAESSVTVHMKDKLMPLEECPKDKPVLTDCDSVESAIDVGRMSDEEFSARQTVVDLNAVQAVVDMSSGVPDASDPKNSKEDVGGIFSRTVPVVTLPTKPHRLTPNITLGRDPRHAYFPLGKGIKLDYGEVTAPGREWTYKKVEEDGEEKIRFTPSKEGEFEIPVMYNGGMRAVFLLTVNPDPWSLWQIKEPADDALVFEGDKKRRDEDRHQNIIFYEKDGLQVIGASRRGRSHEHSGTFRDDDMGFWSDEKTGRYVFMVSDGAGSCKYSREGSRLAIKFIREKLDANLSAADWGADGQELDPKGKIGMKLAGLANYANTQLKKYVDDENAKHPDDKWNLKDFSATILIAALKRDSDGGLRLVTFSIGDGAIAWRNWAQAGIMCSPDSGEFGGGTRFLTTPEVWTKIFPKERNEKWTWETFCQSRVHCKCFSKEEARNFSLFLMTDGVSDPWFETEAGLEDARKWCKFIDETLMGTGYNKASVSLGDNAETNARRLLDWLNFRISGNHDDRTLIMAFTTDVAKKEVCNG